MHDIENVCFICEITKQEFNNEGLSYTSHVQTTHYIWNYVYYIIGLLEKEPSEYTGIESYIAAKYKAGEIDWVPYHETALIKKSEKGVTDRSQDVRIGALEDKLQEIFRILRPDDKQSLKTK